ncbi:hypothetical protein G5B46_12700 [Caulobacter sp. 602-2]|uniref:Uncharacterized protein n=1 Tax=Caulobacter sp. 602-2 TaxID=2710887 RepID=A0A6G4QY55_9CAUL|nr:hypothetical protein [Caulobacter sp. 602-2]NGM50471.1 hypothetical protein [Caulobacter sp. 602-2]
MEDGMEPAAEAMKSNILIPICAFGADLGTEYILVLTPLVGLLLSLSWAVLNARGKRRRRRPSSGQ